MNFAQAALRETDYILSWRRHFHQYPELSLREFQTTDTLERELTALGIPVTRFDGHTGLIATITGSQPGRTILLRADIDALPIRESTGLPYASVNGAMHACGHDCHTAMLLGAAKLLSRCRQQLRGTVRLLFQAAEETSNGAEFYISQGCLNDVDGVFGIHIWSTFPSPLISLEPGPRMSACDNFELIIHGKSAHGANPHQGCDAIVAAAAAVTMLQGYTARRHDPFSPLVITLGTIHGGQKGNILADTVTMTGTARCFDQTLRARLRGDLEELFTSACRPYGCTAELIWHQLADAVVNSDPHLLEVGRSAVRTLYGEDALGHLPAMTVSEDFAYYSRCAPTLFGFLGGGNAEVGAVHPHHNECFCIDEAVLPRGAALYAQFAADYLNGEMQ